MRGNVIDSHGRFVMDEWQLRESVQSDSIHVLWTYVRSAVAEGLICGWTIYKWNQKRRRAELAYELTPGQVDVKAFHNLAHRSLFIARLACVDFEILAKDFEIVQEHQLRPDSEDNELSLSLSRSELPSQSECLLAINHDAQPIHVIRSGFQE